MDRFDVRLIPAGHPDHALVLHRSLNVEPPGRSSRPAPEVAGLLASVRRQGLSIDLLLGAYQGSDLRGASVAVASPGRAAMVFASRGGRAGMLPEATAAALRTLQVAAKQRSIAVLEALVDAESKALAGTLEAAGFRHLTRLRYLKRGAGGKLASERAARDLRWCSFRPEMESLFCAALESTYVQSLDCPELTELRPVADVLAGHRATGIYDPSLWWAVMRAGEAVGTLLMSRIPSERALEIVYVGVAQPARGTGVADALLERAVLSAGQVSAKALTLAVDERNTPALKMYARWGFVPSGVREAWIATPLRT